jgi:hypothetical protein
VITHIIVWHFSSARTLSVVCSYANLYEHTNVQCTQNTKRNLTGLLRCHLIILISLTLQLASLTHLTPFVTSLQLASLTHLTPFVTSLQLASLTHLTPFVTSYHFASLTHFNPLVTSLQFASHSLTHTFPYSLTSLQFFSLLTCLSHSFPFTLVHFRL